LIELLRPSRLSIKKRHFTKGYIKNDANNLMARIAHNTRLPTRQNNEPMARQSTDIDALCLRAKLIHSRRVKDEPKGKIKCHEFLTYQT
jgi:hypothetical protein